MIPILHNLSLVFNLPSSTNQTKISIRNGTNPFHIPFTASKLWGISFFANSSENDFTENSPVLTGVQMVWSRPSWRSTALFNKEWSESHSQQSWGRNSRLRCRLQCQSCPSQKPQDETNAFVDIVRRKMRGHTTLSWFSPTQTSCQNKVLVPSPIFFLILWVWCIYSSRIKYLCGS